MITRLHIENYILIESLELTIEKGLNTITGETGAGKSILLGAVSLLLGGRGDNTLIKQGAGNLVIEADFDTTNIGNNLKPLFETEDVEYTPVITIRRIISASGKSKNYINDEPVTQSFLKEVGAFLVDIHSQHQTLLLSNRSFQTAIVDSVAGTKALLSQFRDVFHQITAKKSEIEQLREANEKAKRDRDYIEYQFQQLSDAALKNGEKEELENEHSMLSNAATIGDAIYRSNTMLYGGEENIITSLQSVNSAINHVSSYLPTGEELTERLTSLIIEAKDINRELELIGSKIEDNPKRLLDVEARLDTLMTLEQKHGVNTTEDLIALQNDFEQKLMEMDNSDEQISLLHNQLLKLEKQGWEVALKIREKRNTIAEKLGRDIVKNLVLLGMPNANLKVEITAKETLGEDGADDVTFLFSANNATTLEKIDKVASGGEMSRLMLALKVIASEEGTMPTIIFDEIDTGVSGKVADQMGSIMEKLSRNIQIINITHLPQVASKGEHHFYVYKEHAGGESHSHIIKLTKEERIKEIAVMLSGSNVTEAAIEQAKALLNLS
ncbi:MAG: DNA repair protein RecN [Rikenellaceae bacterium]